MPLLTYEPFRNLARLQGDVARMMHDALQGGERETAYDGSFAPPVDIVELDDSLLLLADIPGIERNSIDVSVENRMLRLSGERRRNDGSEGGRMFRAEREHGRFARVFALPATVDPERITAEYQDGVLRVVLPKAVEARSRRIEVQVG
jgi:HSP20 family protein